MSAVLPYPEYYKSLAKKPVSGGALIFDEQGRLLILKTVYKDGWVIPGGMVDEEESPLAACIREIREELGQSLQVGRLLMVDYRIESVPDLKDDYLQFIFDGGILSEEQIQRIKLDKHEHSEFRFVSLEEAIVLLHPRLAKRMPHVVQAHQTDSFAYLEDGAIVENQP